jgi:hypothetical protein
VLRLPRGPLVLQDEPQLANMPLEDKVQHHARAAVRAAADPLRCAVAAHMLTACLLRARGFDHACELAALAASAGEPAPGSRPSAADGPGARAGPLVCALVGCAAEGSPASLPALHALGLLASVPPVLPRLLASPLLAVLLGALRAAASSAVEAQLRAAGLGLMAAMARADGAARARLAAMRGVAAALAAALRHAAAMGGGGGVALQLPALQLVQVRVLTGCTCRRGTAVQLRLTGSAPCVAPQELVLTRPVRAEVVAQDNCSPVSPRASSAAGPIALCL